jgi:SAM-dependent methyltransferase
MDQNEQMAFFYELFDSSLPRLGPGDDFSTRQALNRLLALRPQPEFGLRILDIGCGNGAQTLQLARHTDGSILAIDNHQPFLDELQRRAQAAGVSQKIQACLRDMHDLGPDDGPFDLIWSEGALYIMGFQEGLAACLQLLAPGGMLAVSELCWLRPDPPPEGREYFAREYPAMTDIAANVTAIKNRGYELIEQFTLPESAWWDSYYLPLEERLQLLRKQYAGMPDRIEMLQTVETEIEMFRRYSDYYGYVFYVMQRP